MLISTTAAAYAQPGMTEVSGKYTSATGVEITFPDGWSGAEIQSGATVLVLVAPGGISGSEVKKSITLTTADKTGRDPNDPGSFNNDLLTCNAPSISSRTVAGVQAREMVVVCPGTEQTFKMDLVETGDKWVIVSYMAPSAEFDSDVGKFDAAVNSLTVQGAVDSGGSGGITGGLELTALTRTVVIAGANVNVNIRSNSTIGQLTLDEPNKKVSFSVDGETGTRGTTEIAIGTMLEGPYTVTIDGQVITDVVVSNAGSASAVMTISYTHSAHDVAISGTSVVPEFPLAALGAIAAVIGTVVVVGRTRLFKHGL